MPGLGLDDAARLEHHQSVVTNPWCCGQGFLWHVGLYRVQRFLPCLPAGRWCQCLWACEVFLASPAQLCPVPAAVVWPRSVAQGECCPLTWPVGNELQLLVLSVPDAFPLHRHCAAFGTQLCFVNTK